ncbi:MAG: hypothetical protein R3B89_14925 [Polyangiaceae bacterium]
MNLKRASLGLAVLMAGAGVGSGCTDSGGSCEDTLSCGSAGSGGTAGSGGSSIGGSAERGPGRQRGQRASGGAAGSGATGGSAGTAGAGGTGVQCDETSAPGDDACVIDDQYAIFVSPSGDDTSGDGSMATPFASIANGHRRGQAPRGSDSTSAPTAEATTSSSPSTPATQASAPGAP